MPWAHEQGRAHAGSAGAGGGVDGGGVDGGGVDGGGAALPDRVAWMGMRGGLKASWWRAIGQRQGLRWFHQSRWQGRSAHGRLQQAAASRVYR
jgi:hypothetical protein